MCERTVAIGISRLPAVVMGRMRDIRSILALCIRLISVFNLPPRQF